MMDFLWKSIIRPPRKSYEFSDLGKAMKFF